MEKKKLINVLAIIAVILFITSMVLVFKNFIPGLTGHATEEGYVNITVTTNAVINITSAGGVGGSKTIDFGEGTVDTGESYALLATNNTVTQGSWTPVDGGFIVENLGNVNVSLNISSSDDAASFIGGSSPEFKFNVSNIEPDACDFSGSVTEDVYTSFTGSTQKVCSVYQNTDSHDELNIDVLLKVPSDSLTDVRSTTITLSYESAE
ncbi:MAG: hypothetical protein ACOCUU_01065 [Nanoarchaeota archaeon]